jgi:hypothetical protein
MSHRTKPHSRWQSIFLWHRYIGLGAALFVIVLAVTGVMLNHTDQLDLQDRKVNHEWLLHWYGIIPPEPLSYATSGQRVTQLGSRLYIDSNPIPEKTTGQLMGALQLDDIYLLAFPNEVELYTPQAELIDRVRTPSAIDAIGTTQGLILVRSQRGWWKFNDDMSEWMSATVDKNSVSWSMPSSALPQELEIQFRKNNRGAGLPLERVILDLHSGRLFGQYGVLLMDGAALLMLFLGFSGLWVWLDRLRKRRAHRRTHLH